MSGWRRLLCVPLAVALAVGMALHAARAGTMALAMTLAAEAPAMPDCDGCGDAAAAAPCRTACMPAFAALAPADAAMVAVLPAPPVAAAPPRLAGLIRPPDPGPPRAAAPF